MTGTQLQHRRDYASPILKAAMAINNNSLVEMDVPESYLDSLPKNGRATLGDIINRYITSDQFSPEFLLDSLDLSTEYDALGIASHVEASVYVRCQKVATKRRWPRSHCRTESVRSSLGMMENMMIYTEKRDLFVERAEG